MRRLFWKIFGWFWGAMVLIGLALYFVVLTTRPDPLPPAWRVASENALQATGEAIATRWESGDFDSLQNSLDQEASRTRTQFWLFDKSGLELLGTPLPRDDNPRDDNAPGEMRPRRGFRGGRPPLADEFLPMRDRVWAEGRTDFRNFGPRTLAAIAVQSASGKRYVLTALMPSPRFGRPAAAPQTQFFGGLVVLLLSGIVCLGLVRYLTAPLVSLGTATQKLAAGDLSARTLAAQSKRRDEVADLGRDFDTMAARIENLVGAQRQLLGDISHELRSPLARLALALALARRHAASAPPEMQPALDRIARETTRLNALIGQLLELARLESGAAVGNEKINLQEVVREVVADADYEAKNQNRAVEVVAATACVVVGTRELLHSAIENVVRNAIRHTAPDTTVQVKLELHRAGAVITVRDFGSGAPTETLANLFEPFYRVEAARDRDSGGVGLGLAITDRAIRSHGGAVFATNAEGGGLQIEMRLPVTASH